MGLLPGVFPASAKCVLLGREILRIEGVYPRESLVEKKAQGIKPSLLEIPLVEQRIATLGQERLAAIEAAIMPHLHRTPIFHSATLSRLTGHDVYLKAELFQKTGSYKPRGMLWALMSMSADARKRGVITFSAGNAAQGLAFAGKLLTIG